MRASGRVATQNKDGAMRVEELQLASTVVTDSQRLDGKVIERDLWVFVLQGVALTLLSVALGIGLPRALGF
jgi:hypothetical protein